MGIEEKFKEDVQPMDLVLIRHSKVTYVGYVVSYGELKPEFVELFNNLFGGKRANDHEVVLSNLRKEHDYSDFRDSFRPANEMVICLDLRNCDNYKVLKRYNLEGDLLWKQKE